MQLFELYIMDDVLSVEQWRKIYAAMVSVVGTLGKFRIYFTCQENVIRYFIECKQNISLISNNIDGVVIRPLSDNIGLPSGRHGAERFVSFVTGGSFIDLRERYSIKKAKSLDVVVLDIRAISTDKCATTVRMFFKNAAGHYTVSKRIIPNFPVHLLAIDFKSASNYLKHSVPKFLNIEKSIHMLQSTPDDALFEVETFPYLPQNYFLSLRGYDFDKHSIILGASGTGKSKLIELITSRISAQSQRMNYRIVVIDPHANISKDIAHLPNSKTISFGKNDGADLFRSENTDISSAAELTTTLFQSILADQYNPRMDRLLRFSIYVLMTAQVMSLENLKRFVTDVEYRNPVLKHVEGYVPENIIRFFGSDYNEIRTQYYNQTVTPIVSMIDEMQLQPSLVGENETSLAHTIHENFITTFSLNKVSMGEKVVKTVAGLLIQQIFLLAQARAFNEHILLFIDEVSVVQNPTIAQILSEARKFNLTVILTQQYFSQVEKDLRDAIFANTFNYYVFKVSQEDAEALEGNLNIELPQGSELEGAKAKDYRIRLMTEQSPRECLLRLMSKGQVSTCIKGRTVEIQKTYEQAVHPEDLRPAPAEKLPTRFDEKTASTTVKSVDEPVVSQNTELIETKKPARSLMDLFSSHSSSRKKLTKKD